MWHESEIIELQCGRRILKNKKNQMTNMSQTKTKYLDEKLD